jgi:hypothetical protein
VLLLAVLYLVQTRPSAPTSPAARNRPAAAPRDTSRPAAASPSPSAAGSSSIAEAYRARRSNVQIEGVGRVVRVLADDREGARHERFILQVAGGVSVLVAHNVDLAPRVPVAAGDSVALRGEYEWSPKGGVVHWTHRDPGGRHEAGWIRHDGRLYH